MMYRNLWFTYHLSFFSLLLVLLAFGMLWVSLCMAKSQLAQLSTAFQSFLQLSKKTIYENWTSINWYFPGRGKDEHKWMGQQQFRHLDTSLTRYCRFSYDIIILLFLLFYGPEGHQHDISIQSFINLVETTLGITFEWRRCHIPDSWLKLLNGL